MQLSDWIELAGVLIALGVGIGSICISVKTLKQNSKMIEESTRPYIALHYETLDIQGEVKYIVIKNYGKTGATIKKFEYPNLLKNVKSDDKFLFDAFNDINGIFIAPNQSIILPVYNFPNNIDTLRFHVIYSTENNSYESDFCLKVNKTPQNIRIRPDARKHSAAIIAEALEEMCEKKL